MFCVAVPKLEKIRRVVFLIKELLLLFHNSCPVCFNFAFNNRAGFCSDELNHGYSLLEPPNGLTVLSVKEATAYNFCYSFQTIS